MPSYGILFVESENRNRSGFWPREPGHAALHENTGLYIWFKTTGLTFYKPDIIINRG